MSRFQDFIRSKSYLTNVTPATTEWHRRCLKWLPSEQPTQDDLNAVVMRMRERGLSAAGCNCIGRGVNSYLSWIGSPYRLPRLKEPVKVPETFTERQIKLLVTWKPRTRSQRRLHVLILVLLDTGARISEALGLRAGDIDFDNLLLKLDGKGRRERLVPLGLELRKALFRWISMEKLHTDTLLFGTGRGGRQSRRNVLRSVKALCRDLGFNPPRRTCHAFRHTFAIQYLRNGGGEFRLQRQLGHASLTVTRMYGNLTVTDLQAVHEKISILNARL
jgi:integrase/recombinase XerD